MRYSQAAVDDALLSVGNKAHAGPTQHARRRLMPYLNLDDNFADHPKVDALSDGAFRLHVSGLLYTARHRLDGIVPGDKVARLVPRFKRAHLNELNDRHLWLPHSDGYAIHDYLDWNKSRAEIEEQREHLRKIRSSAGKKGAKSRWQPE